MTTLDEALDRQNRATDPLVQAQRRQTRVVEQEEADVSTLRKIGRIGAAGIEGFNRNLAQILAAPTDIINFLFDKAGVKGTERFIGSSSALIQNLEAARISASPSQETLGERIAGRVGGEIAAAVPFVGVVGRAARVANVAGPAVIAPAQSGRVVQAGRDIARGLKETVVRPAVTKPALSAGIEVGLAASAGAAAQGALEVTEGLDPGLRFGAETTAQVLGAAIPSALVGTVTTGVRAGKRAAGLFTEAGAKRRAGKLLQEKATDVDAVVRRLQDQPDFVPDAELTPGQITDDRGLLMLERQVIRADNKAGEKFEDLAGVTNRAIRRELSRALDPSSGDVSAPSRTTTARVERLKAALDSRAEQAVDLARRRIDEIPDISKADSSIIVREELEAALKDARVQESIQWEALPGFQVPVNALRESILARIAKLTKGADQDDVPQFVRERLVPPKKGETVSQVLFDDAESAQTMLDFRSGLLDRARTARAANESNKARILGEIAEEVRKTMDGAADNVSPEFRVLAKAAKEFSKDLNDKFTRGPVAKVLGFDSRGGAKVESVETLSRLLRPKEIGRPSAQQLIRAVGGNEAVHNASADFLYKTFRDQTVNADGLIDVKAAERFLGAAKYQEVLKEFPDVRGVLENVVDAQRIANAVGKNAAGRKSNILDVRRSRAALFLESKGDPSSQIKAVMRDKNPAAAMRELVRQMRKDKSGKALEGLRALFAEEIIERVTIAGVDDKQVNLVSAANLRNQFNSRTVVGRRNRKVMAVLYDDDAIKRLDIIIDTANAVERSANSKVGIGSDTAQNILAESLGALIGANAGKRIPGGSPLILAGIGRRVGKAVFGDIGEDAVGRLIAQAVNDPNVMKTFLMIPTKKNEALIRARIHGHLVNLGATTIREDAGDEKSTAILRPSPPPNRARASTPAPIRRRQARPELPPPVASPTRRGLGDAFRLGPLQ